MTKYDAHDRSMIIIVSVFLPISFLSVLLRLQARRLTKTHYGWDDLWAIVSFMFYCVWTAFAVYDAQHGGSYDLVTLPLPILEQFLKIAYISTLMIPFCMAAAKASILCFYNRIFSANPTFSRGVKIVMLLNILWCLAATFAAAFGCTPIDGAWIVTKKSKCFSHPKLTIAIEVPNASFDVVIMALSINVLRKLHMDLRHKLYLSVIFILGAFVGLVGFVRIGILYRPKDSAFNLSDSGLWVTVQQGFAVICCCLPTFQPIVGKVGNLVSRYRSLSSILRTSKRDNSKSGGYSATGFDRVDTSSEHQEWVPKRSRAVVEHEDQLKPIEYSLDSINVQSAVHIV